MRIALVGYGRMGHEIEEAALKRGHSIGPIIDVANSRDLSPGNFKGIDVAIEFTTPSAAPDNVKRCLEMGIPVVSGTTGWNSRYDEAVALCRKKDTSFIHSSNFSIGVNILFCLNAELARLMSVHTDYIPSIEEIHHTKKLDAPSGTAITLAEGISHANKNYKGWVAGDEAGDDKVKINSVREGNVPGTHVITWKSDIDVISLRHEAFNRKGLALGAVMAAEFISLRKGVFTMSDVLGF